MTRVMHCRCVSRDGVLTGRDSGWQPRARAAAVRIAVVFTAMFDRVVSALQFTPCVYVACVGRGGVQRPLGQGRGVVLPGLTAGLRADGSAVAAVVLGRVHVVPRFWRMNLRCAEDAAAAGSRHAMNRFKFTSCVAIALNQWTLSERWQRGLQPRATCQKLSTTPRGPGATGGPAVAFFPLPVESVNHVDHAEDNKTRTSGACLKTQMDTLIHGHTEENPRLI